MNDRTAPPRGSVPATLCRTMDEVRAGVDALDKALVALLAERQTYMSAAARIKTARERVHDDARIADVLAKVTEEARRAGLAPEIAEAVWRTLITSSIAFELDEWDRLHGEGGAGGSV